MKAEADADQSIACVGIARIEVIWPRFVKRPHRMSRPAVL